MDLNRTLRALVVACLTRAELTCFLPSLVRVNVMTNNHGPVYICVYKPPTLHTQYSRMWIPPTCSELPLEVAATDTDLT